MPDPPDEPEPQTPSEPLGQPISGQLGDPVADDDVASATSEPTEPTSPPLPQRRSSDPGWLRAVIVVWCFWLLGAWAMAWLSDTSVPRVRWMMFAGGFGLMLVWPAFRLSERIDLGTDGLATGRGAAGPVLLDWLSLAAVYQAVIWSLHLIAGWPLIRGLWLDAAVLSWSLLCALIVAGARRWPNGIARAVGMLLCIALVFAEPAALWLADLAGQEGWPMRISPIQALWELTSPGDGSGTGRWGVQVMSIGLVAILGWSALGLWTLGERVLHKPARSAER